MAGDPNWEQVRDFVKKVLTEAEPAQTKFIEDKVDERVKSPAFWDSLSKDAGFKHLVRYSARHAIFTAFLLVFLLNVMPTGYAMWMAGRATDAAKDAAASANQAAAAKTAAEEEQAKIASFTGKLPDVVVKDDVIKIVEDSLRENSSASRTSYQRASGNIRFGIVSATNSIERDAKHVRDVKITFEPPFKQQPVLTITPMANKSANHSTAHGWVIYSYSWVKNPDGHVTDYVCSLIDSRHEKVEDPKLAVEVHYIAIGE